MAFKLSSLIMMAVVMVTVTHLALAAEETETTISCYVCTSEELPEKCSKTVDGTDKELISDDIEVKNETGEGESTVVKYAEKCDYCATKVVIDGEKKVYMRSCKTTEVDGKMPEEECNPDGEETCTLYCDDEDFCNEEATASEETGSGASTVQFGLAGLALMSLIKNMM